MDEAEVLEIMRSSEALLEGHFELRSGLHSGSFFQCANVLRYPRRAEHLCAALVATIRQQDDGLQFDAVIAPALGGIIVGHELARQFDLPFVFVEKQEGALVMRRFKIEPGARYLVAEDVITRGGRVQETIDIVNGAGGRVEAVAVLVDRSGGRARFGCPSFHLLAMEPVTYEPGNCPLCDSNMPIEHPGS